MKKNEPEIEIRQKQGKKPSRSLSKKLLLSLASLVIFLGGSELILRLAGYGPSSDRLQWLSHEDLHYIPAPSQDTFFGKDDPETGEKRLPIHINQYSQRGPEYPLVKEEREFRIIGLGDSLTFGKGVRDEETYLAVLQEIYEKNPSAAGKVRIVNAAVNGYATIHYLRWMETQVDRYDPDLVLVGCYVGNDMVIPMKGQSAFIPIKNELRKFATCHFVYSLYKDFLWKYLEAASDDQPVEEMEKRLSIYAGVIEDNLTSAEKIRLWEHSLEHIKSIAEIARSRKVDLAVLLIPPPVMALQEKEFPLYDWLQQQVESMDIPTITLLDELRPLGREAWLPHDLGHLSPAGQQRVAQRLHEALKELKLLD